MKNILTAALVLAVLLGVSGCGRDLEPNKVYSISDMAGMDIGVVSNSAGTVYADGYGTLQEYIAAETMLVDLKNGILDCAVLDKDEARTTMHKVHGLTQLDEPLIDAEFCFAVAKENPNLREDVNDALGVLEDNGILEEIIKGYREQGDYVYVSPAGVNRSAGTITIAFDGQFPPYSYDDGSGTLIGIDVDIARAVCDLLNVDMTVTVVPREELVTTAQYGKADLSVGGITNNEADAGLVDFSDPYTGCTQVVVVRK